jgi:hypothetical protein
MGRALAAGHEPPAASPPPPAARGGGLGLAAGGRRPMDVYVCEVLRRSRGLAMVRVDEGWGRAPLVVGAAPLSRRRRAPRTLSPHAIPIHPRVANAKYHFGCVGRLSSIASHGDADVSSHQSC